jgi:ABC-2 type transport system permease protein
VAGIIGLFIGIGFNIVFQRLGANMVKPDQMIQLMMQGDNSLVGLSSRIFPQIKIAVNTLLYSGELKGFVNLLIFLVITIALVTLLIVVGEVLYFKGVIGITETAAKRKRLSGKELDESIVQSSAAKSYVIKELKILFRTPAYFMNCVLMNFLFPVFLFIPVLSQPDLLNELPKLRAFVNAGNLPGYIIAIPFGVMMFIAVANPTASTAISREGGSIFVCKYLPISYKKQIMSKVWSAILLNLIGVVILLITVMVVLFPPVYLLIQVVLLGILVTLFASFSGILIDLAFPKLSWDTEQRAVKQNMNVLLLMLSGLVIGGLTIFAIVALGLNIWVSFAVLAAVYGVLDVLLYWLISTLGVNMFSKL